MRGLATAGRCHVPQLEVPEWTVDQIQDWLACEGTIAVLGARP
jgi:hypothetical protein